MTNKSDVMIIARRDGVETFRKIWRYVIYTDKQGEFIRLFGNKRYLDRSCGVPFVYSDA
jgi:hypothetical protein